MEVLQNRSQIRKARIELERLGISQIESPLKRVLARFGSQPRVTVGDRRKSWDVLLTLEFLRRNLKPQEPILDIGCYASEILLALYGSGYRNLTGADLNPEIQSMPHREDIHYEVTDFMRTSFDDGTFSAITSISVIEHGFDQIGLLSETSRLLRPGGYFIASFDYWPEKIDTTGVRFFDADWTIFSKAEVDDLVCAAAAYSMYPLGPLNTRAAERTIRCEGKEYTFAWVVLKKSP